MNHVKLNYSLSTALTTLLLVGGVTAASAQTLTVTGSVSTRNSGTGLYTYTYTVTPSGSNPGAASFDVSLLTFNFSDPNVVFLSATNSSGSGPLGLTNTYPGTGVFVFDSGTLISGSSENFAFTSADASTGGGTVGLTGVAFNGSGVAAINNVSPAPAPEPGSLVSLAVLSTCLGMGIIARKRNALSL
jgi:hypothetical protein